jgi:hypothetical protein
MCGSALLAAIVAAVPGAVSLAAQNGAAQKGATTAKSASARGGAADKHDLQGIWSFATLTPLERPAEFAGKEFLSDAEAAEWEKQLRARNDADDREAIAGTKRDVDLAYNDAWWDRGKTVVGTHRTSLIVDPKDGRVPALTPEGRKRFEEYGGFSGRGGFDGPEDRSLWERCVANNSMPRLPTGYNNHVQIVQTPEYVSLTYEMIHETRVVPLDGRPHLNPNVRQILGDSRGRWEGDTLVVDVTNFTDKSNFRGSTRNLHLIERYTRVDAQTLLYQFTIDDPTTFVRTWSGELPMAKVAGPTYEYACHEGNYGLRGILAGARVKERAAANSTKSSK